MKKIMSIALGLGLILTGYGNYKNSVPNLQSPNSNLQKNTNQDIQKGNTQKVNTTSKAS